MSDLAIRVENLSKQYRIGQRERYKSLRDVLSRAAAAPFRRLRSAVRPTPGDLASENNLIWALKNVSFQVSQGEVIGIIGRNGAGKSTLLKVLSRITKPTAGFAEIHGRVGSLLEVGTGFHPELTGRENIFLNGAILGMKRLEIERKFDEIVDFAEIEKFLDTPVKRYSSGMYMRLAFAVAANLEPEILLVDEVLAVGDAQFQKKCLGKMGEVAQEGRTVLFVSHNMASLRALCTRGILLDSGNLLFDGSINNVIDAYLEGNEKNLGAFRKIVTPKLIIEKIALTDCNGKLSAFIDTDTCFNINIHYEILKEGSYGLTLSLLKDNIIVFQSMNNQGPPEERIKAKGKYVSICQIPGQLLNDGKYSITLNTHEQNYTNSTNYEEIYSFFVTDGVLVRHNYFGGYRGGIRPLLKWETRKLPE